MPRFFCSCFFTDDKFDSILCKYQKCKNAICEHIYQQKIFYCHQHILKIFEDGIEASLTELELEKEKNSNWIGFVQVEVKSEGEYNNGRTITEKKLTYFPQKLEGFGLDKEISRNFWTDRNYASTYQHKIIRNGRVGIYKLRFCYVDYSNYSDFEQYDYFLVTVESFNVIQVNSLKYKLTPAQYKALLIFLSTFRKLTNQIMPVPCFELITDYCKIYWKKYKDN